MILFILLALVALAVGGTLAVLMMRDPGYVLVAYQNATLETSLWFALGAALLAAATTFAIVLVVRRSLRGGVRVTNWVASRRLRSLRKHSLQGAMLLAEGRWREAVPALLKSAAGVDLPLVNYFGAARAANELGDHEGRDDALDRAKSATPEAAFVTELTRAELQQAAGQWRRSIATLTPLLRQAPRHPLVLRRLFDAHKAVDDWDAVAELAGSLPDEASGDMQATQVAVWRARFAKSKQSADAAEHARNTWRAMPKAMRLEEALLLDYVDILARRDTNAAERVVRQSLKKAWHDSWVRRYATIPSADVGEARKRLEVAAGWLQARPEDPSVLFTLGRLAQAAGDTARAIDHLRASLRQTEDLAGLTAMGRLQAESGDLSAANMCYEKALRLVGAPADEALIQRPPRIEEKN